MRGDALSVDDTIQRANPSSVPTPVTTEFDLERLDDVIAGDRRAQEAFYVAFAPTLARRIVARYGRTAGIDADDLLHDAFAFCFQEDARFLQRFLERFAPEERTAGILSGQLWEMTCGIASNRRRSLRRRRTAMSIFARETKPGYEPDAVARDTLVRLQDCLRGAGSRVFLYFKLRFIEGLSAREIARVTGWSLQSTYNLRISLNRAFDRCRERLGLR